MTLVEHWSYLLLISFVRLLALLLFIMLNELSPEFIGRDKAKRRCTEEISRTHGKYCQWKLVPSKPRNSFQNCLKAWLKVYIMDNPNWEVHAIDRNKYKNCIHVQTSHWRKYPTICIYGKQTFLFITSKRRQSHETSVRRSHNNLTSYCIIYNLCD